MRSESDLAPKANARWSSRSHLRYFQGRKPLNQSRLYCQIIRQLLFDDSKIAYLVENHIGLYVMSIFFTFIEVIREISTISFEKCYLTGRKFQCYNRNRKKAKSRGSPHNSPQISKSIHRYDLSRIGIWWRGFKMYVKKMRMYVLVKGIEDKIRWVYFRETCICLEIEVKAMSLSLCPLEI